MKIISFHTLITIFWSTISLSNRNAIFAFSDISKTTINNIDIIQSYNEGIVESLALPSINTSLLRPIKSKTELVSNRYLRNITTTTNPNITIERYDVYNSITDQRIIINLIDNAIINLHTYNLSSPNDINIRAIVRGKPLRSIKFSIMNSGNNDNNKTNINIIKNKRPYGLCGNTNRTDYNKCTGMFDEVDTTYTITGTPYSMINGTGRQGASVTKTFQIKLDQCMTPKFEGNWTKYTPYPINIGESIGGIINDDLVIISGFANGWFNTTRKVYSYNLLSGINGVWKEMDDVPVPVGFTHSGYVIVDNVLYLCGGYVGGNIGSPPNGIPSPASDVCLKYTHTNVKTKQWSYLPSLPAPRAGGAMLYIKSTNSLLFATGATRSDPTNVWHSTDYDDVWELSLTNQNNGWITKPNIPYKGNHVSFGSVLYKNTEYHYVFGGQIEENEKNGNQIEMYRWDTLLSTWIQSPNLPYGRGHSSSSTISYGCGFITAGGAINHPKKLDRYTRTSDILYYNINTNIWSSIGNLPESINTSVCVIKKLIDGDYLFCQTGNPFNEFSYFRKIIL